MSILLGTSIVPPLTVRGGVEVQDAKVSYSVKKPSNALLCVLTELQGKTERESILAPI
jgi:hypothetical protein